MDVENALNDGKPVGDELCRLCANTDKQFIPIFQEEGMEHNISEQIKKYLPIIRVTKVDKLPLQVCYQCTSTLLSWHNFFEQCRVADNRLREILSVNVEFNKDDESCHDYADDFRDDFDDQPSLSDRICDIPEKSVHFDLTVNEAMDSSDSVNKDSKSVTENADDSRFARKMTGGRGPKDDVCPAPKTAAARDAGDECAGTRSGSAASSCECPKAADRAECRTCAERRGRGARCQRCPMVFLSADRLADHMSSSHDQRRPQSSSTRESANTTSADSRRKRRASESGAPASESKRREVETRPAAPAQNCATTVSSFRCARCPKTYRLASSLKRHSAVHRRLAVFEGDDKSDENGGRNGESTLETDTSDVDRPTQKADSIGNPAEATDSSKSAPTEQPKKGSKATTKKRRLSKAPVAPADQQPALRVDTIVCSVCRQTFDDESAFTEHQRLQHGGAHPAGCDVCQLEWPTATLLRAHKIANHLERQRCRAGADDDPFSRWYVHVDGQKHLKCDQCAYNSLWHNKGRFLEHYRIHTGERPFTCDLCGKQFRTRSLMHKHVTYVHEGVKEHPCDLCGRRFSDKRYMEDHRRIHTGERPYVCDLCGKTFKQGASLFIHKELHKGLRKHACDMCGKRFTTSSSLSVHIKRHVGERNFVCATCGKAFVDGKHLRDHLTVHSDDRPFGCELCGARFKLMKHLKQHGRTHKRDFPS